MLSPEEIEEKLLAHRQIDPETGCWLWTGGICSGGKDNAYVYGRIVLGVEGGKSLTAYVHRIAYEIWVEPAPTRASGGVVSTTDTCGNTLCFNPEHLHLRGSHTPSEEVVAEIVRLHTEERWSLERITREHRLHLRRSSQVREILERAGVGYIHTQLVLNPLEHVLGSITIDGDCWIAASKRVPVPGNKEVITRRFAFQEWLGTIPKNWVVSTTCGNPRCISPDHLWTRPPGGTLRIHPTSVLEIRERSAAGELARDLASEFGCTMANIYAITRWVTWQCAGVVAAQPNLRSTVPA